MSVQTLTAPTVASSPYTIIHNLGTTNVLVQMYDAVTQRQVQAQVAALNTNQIQVSVATNMPNNVNVIIMGATASPVPLFPADLATKAYVDARTPNLPAPITSGSGINSYTDVLGEVWVAKNGVNGGNWKRARDALHARWYRTAALTSTTTVQNMPYDTTHYDAYGLVSNAAGYSQFAAPVSGMYGIYVQLGASPTAAAQYISLRAYAFSNGTAYFWGLGQAVSGSTTAITPNIYCVMPVNAGDYFYSTFVSQVSMAVAPGSYYTFMSVDYLGTG
jgi:hypothetical protein